MVILIPPRPSPFSWTSASITDPSSSHSHSLAETNAARARLRSSLKTRKERGIDWNEATKATTDYLPYLYSILACVEADDLILKAEPAFTWKSTLSTQTLKKGQPKITLLSLHYELSCTLLCHALCLSNSASNLVSSLGTYETSSLNSTANIKQMDETINLAAEMLCRSSGILGYMYETVLPRWEAAVGEVGTKGRPVELERDFVLALSKLMLADANLLAIRRLLSRSLSLSHTTTQPGPPLPSSHPSPSLLAKLHLNVQSLYSTARSLIKSLKSPYDPSPLLRRYLSDGLMISKAMSFKWLGIDIGENGTREKFGMSLTWLECSRDELEEIRGKEKGLKGLVKKGKEGGKARKGKVEMELESVGAFLSAYKKVNNTVHFQTPPTATSLQSLIPSGRAALQPKPFTPPKPIFTPQNLDNLPPPPDIASLRLDGGDDSSDDEDTGTGGGGGGGEEYFGAGSYW